MSKRRPTAGVFFYRSFYGREATARYLEMLLNVLQMTHSWSMFYSSKWVFGAAHLFSDDLVKLQLCVGFAVTLFGFSGIWVMDQIHDCYESHAENEKKNMETFTSKFARSEHKIRKVWIAKLKLQIQETESTEIIDLTMTAVWKAAKAQKDSDGVLAAVYNIIVGLAILIGFAWEQCFDSASEVLGEKVEHHLAARVGLAAFSASLLVPAWLKFILPMTMFDNSVYQAIVNRQFMEGLTRHKVFGKCIRKDVLRTLEVIANVKDEAKLNDEEVVHQIDRDLEVENPYSKMDDAEADEKYKLEKLRKKKCELIEAKNYYTSQKTSR